MSSAKEIRELIIKGRLEDAAEKLLSNLDAAAETGQEEIDKARNQAIFFLSRLNELNTEEREGVVSKVDADLERNQIRKALVELNNRTRDLGKPGFRLSPVPGPTNTGTGDGRKPFPWPWLIAGLALAALLAFMLWPEKEVVISDDDPDPIVNPVDPDPGPDTPPADPNPVPTDDPEIFELVLFPVTKDMGRPTGKSGHLISTGGRAGSPPQFGDTRDNKEVRAFLTFSLDEIPPNSTIVSADFYMNHGGGNFRELDKVFVEVMDVGDQLNADDYNETARPIASLEMANYDNNKSIDLRQEIHLAYRRDRKQITLRFRPDEIIRNGQADVFAFRYNQGRTKMILKIKDNL